MDSPPYGSKTQYKSTINVPPERDTNVQSL